MAPIIRAAELGEQNEIRALIFAILSEYDLEPAPKTTDQDLEDIAGFYKDGIFDVLAGDDGEIIGTVALKPVGGGAVELRKMYLMRDHRGRGYGRRLLKHAIARARAMGFKRMELETAHVLEEALGLYTAFGFERFERAEIERRCDTVLALDL